ncbi:MAG: amidohydrolase family protein [Acidimicrobiales bacterium]
MDDLDYRPFDADNHYYEALDAFTRHLDPAMAGRCVQWCEIGGRKYHVLGGQVSHAVVNPTFDPVAMPGAMHDFFRGNPDGKNPLSFLSEREPVRPAYRDRDARIATLDEHGLDACWLFPTLGMIYEAPLAHDPVAVCATFRAFNRWLIEDWGFAYQDRIYAAPYLTLADPDWAVEELQWAIDNDARLIVMLPIAPTTVTGRKNPFDPAFDPFWQLLNDSGLTVVLHAGDGGVSSNGYAEDGFGAKISGSWQPSIKFFNIENAIKEWLLSFMFANMLGRFPNLRVASVENGAQFLPDLFRKLTSTSHKIPGYFADDPIEMFRRNVWINPFWEDDVELIVELMGADRVLFGSDWPHIEGMPSPLDYLVELKNLDDDSRRKVLSDNVRELTVRRPV